MLRKLVLLSVASLLLLREAMHLSDPFLHNQIDLFLDVFCIVAAGLIVANAFGFRSVSWARTVGPCLAAILAILLIPRQVITPGFRLAEWAEQSPWRGFQPRPLFIDVDPWLIVQADLLIFTAVFSIVMLSVLLIKFTRGRHAAAA